MHARCCNTRKKLSRRRAPSQKLSLPSSPSATRRLHSPRSCRKPYGHFRRRCQTCTSDCTIGATTPFSMVIRDGRLQIGLLVPPVKGSALHDVRYEELFHERVCVVVALQHPFARRRTIPITEVAAEPLIGLTREDYPNYYDYLSIIFSKVKQKPRVVEEYDSFSAVMSAVEAGTGVAIATDFGYSFGNRLKFLHLTPEPKPISVGIVALKGRLSPAAEKFWQYVSAFVSHRDIHWLPNFPGFLLGRADHAPCII